jgi:hypothetical protein
MVCGTMKIINVSPHPPLKCNAPGNAKCPNDSKHIMTVHAVNEKGVPRYATYRVCDGHLKLARQQHELDNPS